MIRIVRLPLHVMTFACCIAQLAACRDELPTAPQQRTALSGAFPQISSKSGQRIFRFDTFGDEQFWTDTLRLHEIIQSSVSPRTALAVGLQVDAGVLPNGFLQGANLDAPATTVQLLALDAVVGLKGEVAEVDGAQ